MQSNDSAIFDNEIVGFWLLQPKFFSFLRFTVFSVSLLQLRFQEGKMWYQLLD